MQSNTGCTEKVDPLKFKLAILTYCINLTTLYPYALSVALNCLAFPQFQNPINVSI